MSYCQWETWVTRKFNLTTHKTESHVHMKLKFVRAKNKNGSPVWRIQRPPPPAAGTDLDKYPKFWLTSSQKIVRAESAEDFGAWWSVEHAAWAVSTSSPPMEKWAVRNGLKQLTPIEVKAVFDKESTDHLNGQIKKKVEEDI
jgi:hypothetical protein